MANSKYHTIANYGYSACIIYIIINICMIIQGCGYREEYTPELHVEYDWDFSYIIWELVGIAFAYIIFIVIPWFWYFDDLKKNNKFRFYLPASRNPKSKIWNIIYTIFNLVTAYTFGWLVLDLCFPNNDIWTDSNLLGWFFKISFILLIYISPLYVIITFVIFIGRIIKSIIKKTTDLT